MCAKSHTQKIWIYFTRCKGRRPRPHERVTILSYTLCACVTPQLCYICVSSFQLKPPLPYNADLEVIPLSIPLLHFLLYNILCLVHFIPIILITLQAFAISVLSSQLYDPAAPHICMSLFQVDPSPKTRSTPHWSV